MAIVTGMATTVAGDEPDNAANQYMPNTDAIAQARLESDLHCNRKVKLKPLC